MFATQTTKEMGEREVEPTPSAGSDEVELSRASDLLDRDPVEAGPIMGRCHMASQMFNQGTGHGTTDSKL